MLQDRLPVWFMPSFYSVTSFNPNVVLPNSNVKVFPLMYRFDSLPSAFFPFSK